jgi:hypothetical protein
VLLKVDQPRQPRIDNALLLAAEGDDEEVVLRGEIARQLVLRAVESPSGQWAKSRRLRRGERAPETGESTIADTVERERQERVGEPEQPCQREVGVVGDACAPPAVDSNVIRSREITAAFSPRKVTACGGSYSTIR